MIPWAPAAKEALTEYELLMGGADQEARVPNPSEIGKLAYKELSDPFYDKGPNDKGIGLQLLYSIKRVMMGYLLAALVAIPIRKPIGIA